MTDKELISHPECPAFYAGIKTCYPTEVPALFTARKNFREYLTKEVDTIGEKGYVKFKKKKSSELKK